MAERRGGAVVARAGGSSEELSEPRTPRPRPQEPGYASPPKRRRGVNGDGRRISKAAGPRKPKGRFAFVAWIVYFAVLSAHLALSVLFAAFGKVHEWLVSMVVDDFLGVAEETTRAVCRECVRQLARVMNAGSAYFISLVEDKSYWIQIRREFKANRGSQGAWRKFWDANRHNSSFNALFELGEKGAVGGEGEGESTGFRRSKSTPVLSKRRRKEAGKSSRSKTGGSPSLRRFRWLPSWAGSKEQAADRDGDSFVHTMLADMADVSSLLEDVSVGVQRVITRFFASVRWLMRLFMLRPRMPSRKAARGEGSEEGSDGSDEASPISSLFANTNSARKKVTSIMDTITGAGYPFAKYSVETSDGYVLELYRIPRKDARRAVILQHGLMDSAHGWVFYGSGRSLALAAYDSGFDVFLGNTRGAPPRKHMPERTKNYWKFSMNELGIYDITAMVDQIHRLKTSELCPLEPSTPGEPTEEKGAEKAMPRYELSAVGHSLGGAALLLYLSTALKLGTDARLHRLLLLSPAGIHSRSLPLVARVLCAVDTMLGWAVKDLNFGMTMYGSIVRVGAQKFALDVAELPGLNRLVHWMAKVMFSGDRSLWGAEMVAPYMVPYTQSMPGFSWGIVRHGNQILRRRTFVYYDFGTAEENVKHYGVAEPPEVSAQYGGFRVPVDLVSGSRDGIVNHENVRQHYREMKQCGVQVTYKQFDMGHLDFTFHPSEEFIRYAINRLCLS